MLGKNFLKQFSHHSVAMYISYTPKYVHNWQPCVAWLDYYNFLTVSSFDTSQKVFVLMYVILYIKVLNWAVYSVLFLQKKRLSFPPRRCNKTTYKSDFFALLPISRENHEPKDNEPSIMVLPYNTEVTKTAFQ